MTKLAIRLYAIAAAALLLTLGPSRADAQYRPRGISNAAIGENYHIELSAALWDSSADMSLSNTALDLTGTTISLQNDLGVRDQKFPGFDLVFRPGLKHKLRAQLVPVHYAATASPSSAFNFGGQTFPAGVPVSSTIHWKAWRFGYEYDAAVGPRGFLGFILNVKYTDVDASLTGATAGTRSVSAHSTVPAIGGILRVYPAARLSLTGEISGFKWPGGWIWSGSGDFLDLDAYATLNVVNAIGVEAGYRSFDVDYSLTNDTGHFKLTGPYVGAVLRF
jgi:hypothetical protein